MKEAAEILLMWLFKRCFTVWQLDFTETEASAAARSTAVKNRDAALLDLSRKCSRGSEFPTEREDERTEEAAGGGRTGLKPLNQEEEEETTAGVQHVAAAPRLCLFDKLWVCDGFGGWRVFNLNQAQHTVL